MRKLGDARAVVDGGDPELREPGDIGPAELGPRRAAHRRGEGHGRPLVQPRPGTRSEVDDRDVPAVEDVTHVLFGGGHIPVRREAVVHRDHAPVRDHVAGHAASDADRVQALVVAEAVDRRLPRLVAAQHVQDAARLVDGVAPHPGAGTVRTTAGRGDFGPHGALAAAFDLAAARLHQHCEVPAEQLRALPAEPSQAVALRLDLLAVVEDVGDVAHRLGHAGRQPQLHSHPGLHVRGPAAVEPVLTRSWIRLDARRQVAGDRDGVDVAGQHHALGPAQVGASHDAVAFPVHAQVRQRAQGGLDRAGELILRTADRGDVDDVRGERRRVGGQVQFHARSLAARYPADGG